MNYFRLVASLAGFLVVIAAPVSGLASTYGSGQYGSCTYGNGCAAASSSGGSSSSPAAAVPGQILLNSFTEYTSGSGKALDLSAGQVVYFDITSGGQTLRYSATVKQVGDNFVVLSISGISSDVTLKVGETQSFDVNGDGINDIEITLVSIKDGVASFIFKEVLGASNSKTTQPAAIVPAAAHRSILWLTLSVLAIIVALLIFTWLFWRRRHRNQEPGPY